MPDVQNIPNPDDTVNENNDGLGSHSDVEQDLDNENADATLSTEHMKQGTDDRVRRSDEDPAED